MQSFILSFLAVATQLYSTVGAIPIDVEVRDGVDSEAITTNLTATGLRPLCDYSSATFEVFYDWNCQNKRGNWVIGWDSCLKNDLLWDYSYYINQAGASFGSIKWTSGSIIKSLQMCAQGENCYNPDDIPAFEERICTRGIEFKYYDKLLGTP